MIPRTIRYNYYERLQQLGRKSMNEELLDLAGAEKPDYIFYITYQDQVMFIAQAIADYTLDQADILRKAMGKKKKEVMAQERAKFIAGARNQGVDAKTAAEIFDLILPFAGYGFNAAHAACYAMVAYQTAYLKAHYQVEFMAALLTCEMQNSDKVVEYIGECNRMEIEVLPPSVNESYADFRVVKGAIRFGLAAVKGAGSKAVFVLSATRP